MVTHKSQQGLTPALSCPCGKASSTDLERIPRGFLIKIFLFWLPLKRYKCMKCRRKKLVFKRSHA